MTILILIEMLFLHCFADCHLQGILASMKQKEWWIKQAPNQSEFDRSMYKNDYKVALVVHSFEWSFVMLLPIFLRLIKTPGYNVITYISLLAANGWFHYWVDDEKANKKNLNLIGDQIFHLCQIVLTWLIWTIFIGWR